MNMSFIHNQLKVLCVLFLFCFLLESVALKTVYSIGQILIVTVPAANRNSDGPFSYSLCSMEVLSQDLFLNYFSRSTQTPASHLCVPSDVTTSQVSIIGS